MKKQNLITTFNKLSYQQKIKKLFGQSLVAYFPLSETSGSTAFDISGNGYNGTYAGITLGGYTNPFTKLPAPSWPGTNVNFHVLVTTAMANVGFNEGGISFWMYCDETISSSTTARDMFSSQNTLNSGSYYTFGKDSFQYRFVNKLYVDGVFDNYGQYNYFVSGWHQVVMTWSVINNTDRVYIDNNLIYNIGKSRSNSVFPTTAYIGRSLQGQSNWQGSISDFVAVNRYITPNEANYIFNLSYGSGKKISIIGDSISTTTASYPYYTAYNYGNYRNSVINHAVAGAGIIASMAGQVTAAANDNAQIIILEMGTNDDNAGDMSALQTVVENSLIALKASNPGAIIYYINVFARWTTTAGLVPVDKANIRAAIATACSSQNVTCWDTFTVPWFSAAQTTDGLHPNSIGHGLITSQILTRI